MRRYWVSPNMISGQEVTLDGDTFHHICHVCRQANGDRFEVLTEGSLAYLVELTQVGKKAAAARILETREIPPLPEPRIVLAISLPKFQKLEWILEKAVEMGVSTVIPFVSDNSFMKTVSPQVTEKLPRWQKIVLSATEQSGRGDLMPVAPPLTLQKVLESFNQKPNAAGLFSYEGEARLEIKARLGEIRALNPAEIWVFVGSEGGFSAKEVELFQKVGLSPVTLGHQVLRVETACVVLVSVLKYEFDLLA